MRYFSGQHEWGGNELMEAGITRLDEVFLSNRRKANEQEAYENEAAILRFAAGFENTTAGGPDSPQGQLQEEAERSHWSSIPWIVQPRPAHAMVEKQLEFVRRRAAIGPFMRFVNGVMVALGFVGMTGLSDARSWTNDKGQVIEADYVSSDGNTVELSRAGKTFRYDLAKLSREDRDFVKEQMNAPVPAAKSARVGWIADFAISKPAFPDTKGYLTGRNAKAVYKAFASGEFPSSWSVNKKDAEHEFAYADGKAIVYVPASYDDKKPLGVYLHVSPGDGGENVTSYAPVMDRLGLIYVSAKGTSNNQPMLRRVKLSVDALAAVKAEWKVDPKRVCVGGLSGGGHMAMLIHAMFPELFVGSVSHAAQSYLPGGGSCGHFPGLEPGDLKSGPMKGHKWCVISGDKDQNHQEILKSSKEWEDGRFAYRFFDVPGMGHTNALPEKLEEALRWIGVATAAS